MSARLCSNCGTPIACKPAHQPGPQPKYCGRRCQTIASHRAYRERNRRNAEAARALAGVDWARVPAGVIEDIMVRYAQPVDGSGHRNPHGSPSSDPQGRLGKVDAWHG